MSTRKVEHVYPLSGMQQLMLLHERGSASSSALSSRFVYRVTGGLDVQAFRLAWERLVLRHAALRTAFLWEGLDQPLQAVKREAPLPFDQLDHRQLSAERQQLELDRLLEQDSRKPYELSKPPLMRLLLIQTADAAWTFVWSNHHLILDRWCLDPLFADLEVLYRGGADAELSGASSFRGYIDWLCQQDEAEAESYWRAALRGFGAPALLAPSAAGSAAPAGRRRVEETPPPQAFAALRELAASAKVSFGAAAQAAMALFLARETGRDDIVFGMTVSGRPPELPNVETLIGSFVNNIPVRARFPRERPVEEWLSSFHAAEARRARFSHVSAARIHQWSSVSLGQPLFDSLLLVGSPAAAAHQWDGVRLEAASGSLDSAYPALFVVDEAAGKLSLAFDSARIEPPRAQNLLQQLALALADLPSFAGRPISGLLASPAAAPPPAGPPRQTPPAAAGSAEDVLLGIWREALGRPQVGLDDDFFELGGTSLQAAQAFLAVEQRLGRRAPFSALLEAGTVRAFATRLGQAMTPHFPALLELRSRGSRPPLILVPPGDPAMLASVTRELGNEQPVYGLTPKGLYDQEEPETDFSRIVDYFLEAIQPLAKEPFVLGGVCWGAAVAFEMANRLAAAGSPPAGLALIFPPLVLAEKPKRVDPAAAKAELVRQRLALYWSDFRKARGVEKWRYLRQKSAVALRAARSGSPFDQAESEVRRIRADRANRAAIAGFQPQPYTGHTALFVTPPPHNQAWRATFAYWRKLAPADAGWYEIPAAEDDHGLYPSNSADAARRLEEFVTAVLARRR